MSVQINGIKFNHTPGTINIGALMIRKDATTDITAPEWVPNMNHTAKAAYSIQDTTNNSIQVHVLFTSDVPGRKVKIKAEGGGQFGHIAETEITINNSYIPLVLSGTDLAPHGVNILATKWNWSYKIGNGGWVFIRETHFTIYTVLAQPYAPWSHSTNFNDTQLPWTDVLDVTNRWAQGSTTTDEAAGLITMELYDLGESIPAILEYDTTVGASNYSTPDFRCTEFLERCHGLPGLGSKVNCADCATIVSSFANILGSQLWQSQMRANFQLRPLRAIGLKRWEAPFGGYFIYHEVAWKNACDVTDNLYDGCLEVNTNRVGNDKVPLLPRNMEFGACTDLTKYRSYLTTTTGCPDCLPDTTTRKRRTIS